MHNLRYTLFTLCKRLLRHRSLNDEVLAFILALIRLLPTSSVLRRITPSSVTRLAGVSTAGLRPARRLSLRTPASWPDWGPVASAVVRPALAASRRAPETPLRTARKTISAERSQF